MQIKNGKKVDAVSGQQIVMVELIIEVKNGTAYLATWQEDWSGVRIKRLIAPAVGVEDIEEALKNRQVDHLI